MAKYAIENGSPKTLTVTQNKKINSFKTCCFNK